MTEEKVNCDKSIPWTGWTKISRERIY